MMKKRYAIASVTLLSAALLGLPSAFANPGDSLSNVTPLGDPVSMKSVGGSWISVTAAQPLKEGDMIRTGKSGAILKFPNSVVRCSDNCEVKVLSNGDQARVSVTKGTVLARSDEANSVVVDAPGGGGATGSGATFSVGVGEETRVKVLYGSADVRGEKIKPVNIPAAPFSGPAKVAAPLEVVGPKVTKDKNDDKSRVAQQNTRERTGTIENVSKDGKRFTLKMEDGTTMEVEVNPNTKIVDKNGNPAQIGNGKHARVTLPGEGGSRAIVVELDADKAAALYEKSGTIENVSKDGQHFSLKTDEGTLKYDLTPDTKVVDEMGNPAQLGDGKSARVTLPSADGTRAIVVTLGSDKGAVWWPALGGGLGALGLVLALSGGNFSNSGQVTSP